MNGRGSGGLAQWAAEHWAGILAFAGLFVLLQRWGAPRAAEVETLRSVFHLPAEVALNEVRVNRKMRLAQRPAIAGLVEFSAQESERYVQRLDDPAVWRPVPIRREDELWEGAYSPDALRWHTLPGRRQIGWDALSSRQAQAAKNGRHFCFAVERRRRHEYRGRACWEVGREPVAAVFAQGLIDFDTRTLHMIVRETNP